MDFKDSQNYLYLALPLVLGLLILLAIFAPEDNPGDPGGDNLKNQQVTTSEEPDPFAAFEEWKKENRSPRAPVKKGDKKERTKKKDSPPPRESKKEKAGEKGEGKGEKKEVSFDKGQRILTGKVGTEPGQFGIHSEGSQRGPMSFSIDERGRIWILDQENFRLQIFGSQGRFQRAISLPTNTYDHMSLSEKAVALYNFQDHKIEVYGSQGNLLKEYKLDQKLQPITEVWYRGGKVYVEVSHNQVHRLSESGEIEATLPGRPTGDQEVIKAVKVSGEQIDLIFYKENSSGEFTEVRRKSIPLVTTEITALQTDGQGNLYLGWRHFVDRIVDGEREIVLDEQKLLKLDPQGNYITDISLNDEQFADLRRGIYVASDGTVYQLNTTSEEVNISKY